MIRSTWFCVAAVLVIGAHPVWAVNHVEALILQVGFVEGNPAGISVGDEIRGEFEADESILLQPDGVHVGRFVAFDLTIGPVNWNESHVTTPPEFLISGGTLIGVRVTLTDTLPAHPDLTLTLPLSPGAWSVDDENDLTDQPIFGGNFGGPYTLEFIPEDSVPALGGPWYTVLAMILLTTGVVYSVIRTRFTRSRSG